MTHYVSHDQNIDKLRKHLSSAAAKEGNARLVSLFNSAAVVVTSGMQGRITLLMHHHRGHVTHEAINAFFNRATDGKLVPVEETGNAFTHVFWFHMGEVNAFLESPEVTHAPNGQARCL